MTDGLPLEQAREYLKSLDLSAVIERLVRIEKWHRSEAEAAAEQYRNFLYLKKKYGNEYVLPPSENIDEVWHAHILHTKQYIDFCDFFYGSFLHHHPHLEETQSVEKLNTLFVSTQNLYYKEFGDYIYDCKPEFILTYVFKKALDFLKRRALNSLNTKPGPCYPLKINHKHEQHGYFH